MASLNTRQLPSAVRGLEPSGPCSSGVDCACMRVGLGQCVLPKQSKHRGQEGLEMVFPAVAWGGGAE